ncbi:two-component system, HptB-dependent secretion and biofilm response regulator [Gammaproteobacteria bacterium]
MFINPINKPILLVVDDTPENIDVLKHALSSSYTIRVASNGYIALKAANIQPRPNLVLLDIIMPEMDGYEVCRQLKSDAATNNIPIIFVTAKSEQNDELEGLNLGAVDYITKPFRIPIVQARIKTHLALQAAKQELDKHNQLLLQERELIEAIILKMRKADSFDERYLRYVTSPVEKTAGDILLSTFTPDGRQLVFLGDFTGHGLSAAIGGPLVTYILHELAKRNFSGEKILDEINHQLCAKLPTGIFLAVTLLEFSLERTRATLWNAGFPETLLIRNGLIHARFPSGMFPLGISRALNIHDAAMTVSLEKGDRLYAFSDGIIEAKAPNGEMFGINRLEIFLEKLVAGENSLDALITLLDDYVGLSIHDDDITLVEVKQAQ